MKSIIAAVLTCTVLFGVSLATTKLLYAPAVPEPSEETVPPPDPVSQDQTPEADSEPMPVALRPDHAVSVEAVLQMSDSIKKMEQSLIGREQRLVKQEQRIKLLFEDLATEQDELRAFSEGIDAKVESLQRMTAELRAMLSDLDARKIELEDLAKKTGSDDESKQSELDQKVNDVKSWFAGLQPEQAATYLKDFANNGKLEFAAALLHKMPDRQKSKILDVMSDSELVDQLIESLSIPPKK